MKIIHKKIIHRSIFLVLTIVVYNLLPTLQIGQPWPYNLLPGALQTFLGYFRLWVALPAICFAAVFLDLHFISVAINFPSKKNCIYKRIFVLLSIILVLSLIYWVGGSLFYLAPMPPLSFIIWVAVFAKSRFYLCCWWGITAICMHLAIEF